MGEGERHNKETAAAVIKGRVEHWAAMMGLGHGRVLIKSQRTLWGSCSAKGNLNFNWRLAFAPRQVLDYVVIHELAHLRELNHSKRFWAMVEKYCPDFRVNRRWLHDNQRAIYRRREAKNPPPQPSPTRGEGEIGRLPTRGEGELFACYNSIAERPEGRSAA